MLAKCLKPLILTDLAKQKVSLIKQGLSQNWGCPHIPHPNKKSIKAKTKVECCHKALSEYRGKVGRKNHFHFHTCLNIYVKQTNIKVW